MCPGLFHRMNAPTVAKPTQLRNHQLSGNVTAPMMSPASEKPNASASPTRARIAASSGQGSCVFPKPERQRRRVKGAAHHPGEVHGEPPKVDLFTESRGKAVYHSGSVIARAVESSIDKRLNPASHRVEQRRRRQSRTCYRQRIALSHQGSESQDGTGVHRCQDGSDDRVGNGPADQPVNLVQAVAEDGHADGDGQQADSHGEGDVRFYRETCHRLEEVLG